MTFPFPFIPPKVTAGGYSCTMTAGVDGGDAGFSVAGAYGSINAEPVPGETCEAIGTSGGAIFIVSFTGDITATLSGLHVWVDGVDYGAGEDIGLGAGWHVNAGSTLWARTSPTLPTFSNGVGYLIEIK